MLKPAGPRLASETLTDVLGDAGYQVTAMASAREAIEWAASGEPFDLVLTDVRMGGVDGIEGQAKLRELQPQVRGIIMTGFASPDAPRRAISAGAWDYLYKPFDQAE